MILLFFLTSSSNLFFTDIQVLHCREPVLLNPVLHSTFVLIKHRVIPMDLVLVQTPSQQFYSFLSVTWGIVADIDFESEKYRNLGEARFTLGAIKRIVSKCNCITNKKEKGGGQGITNMLSISVQIPFRSSLSVCCLRKVEHLHRFVLSDKSNGSF